MPSPADGTAVAGSTHARRRAELPWVENTPPAGWRPRLDVRELWAERELALVLALKDVTVRYKQTYFGVAWALLQPLVGVLIFTLVFGRAVRLPTDGLPYPVFVYAGLAIWLYFTSAVSASAQSLVDNRDLVAKVYFPRLLAPLAGVLPGLVDLAVSLPVLGVFLLLWSVAPGWQVLLLPLWILAALATSLGVGLLLAGLNVRYRDVRFVLPYLLQVWLFASPVVYSISVIEGAWRYVYAINPMATVVTGFRWSVAGGTAPGAEAFVSLAVVAVAILAGLVYFDRVQRSFADVV